VEATGYGAWRLGFNSRKGQQIFSTPQRPYQLWGPLNLLYNGYWELSPDVKRLEREADHPSPSSIENKNDGAIPPLTNTFSWHDYTLFRLKHMKTSSCMWILSHNVRDCRRGLDWILDLSNHLYTRLGTTSYYSAWSPQFTNHHSTR
jgi:hypothetical protein